MSASEVNPDIEVAGLDVAEVPSTDMVATR
jgi:hypothetical protein